MLNSFFADYFSDYLKLNLVIEFKRCFEFKLHFISKIPTAKRNRFQYLPRLKEIGTNFVLIVF